jgi:hypothetical protein
MGKTNKVQPLTDVKEGLNHKRTELPSIGEHLLDRNFNPNLDPNDESPDHKKVSKLNQKVEIIQKMEIGKLIYLNNQKIMHQNYYFTQCFHFQYQNA